MITTDEVTIAAPPDAVWAVYTDVERWPTWTASVKDVRWVGGDTVAVGARVRIVQPWFPPVVWTVTELDPGVSWTWANRAPGATTIASHELRDLGDGCTLVTQTIEQRGPLGVLVGLLSRRLTRRYLAMEGAGLRARTEAGATAA